MFRHGDPGGRMYGNVGASNANLLAHWTGVVLGGGAALSVSPGNGRLGGSSLRFATNTNSSYLIKTLDAQAIWGIAFAFRASQISVGTSYTLCAVADAGVVQVDLRLNVDGTLSVTRAGTVLGTTTSYNLSANSYTHIEFKTTINNVTGTYEVRVNGQSKLSGTNVNTRSTTNNSGNGIVLGSIVTSHPPTTNLDYDDFIVWDSQPNDANGFPDIHDFIGDCGLFWSLPNGPGTTTQWVPDSGANYARVNEATPDGDTSYVSDATVNDLDTYAMTDLPANITGVKSIAVCNFMKKTDTAARTLAAALRTVGTNYSHPTVIAPGTSYQYYFSNWGSNPNTGAAWSVADINAIEVGQKVIS